MPWFRNEKTDEETYIVSIYAKEELPTWNELWNEFWNNGAFSYDPNDASQNVDGKVSDSRPATVLNSIDLYWKLSHRKLLLGWVCNQLNKLLFEDKMIDTMLAIINGDIRPDEKTCDMRFGLLELEAVDDGENYDTSVIRSPGFAVGSAVAPAIYTCELPSTGERSLFASSHPAVNIKDLTRKFELVLVLSGDDPDDDPVVLNGDSEDFRHILALIFLEVGDYFSGDVGWKDKQGNNLPVEELQRRCENSGFDPAL